MNGMTDLLKVVTTCGAFEIGLAVTATAFCISGVVEGGYGERF